MLTALLVGMVMIVKILTVAMDSVAVFYFRKQHQDCKKGITLILSTCSQRSNNKKLIYMPKIAASWSNGFGCGPWAVAAICTPKLFFRKIDETISELEFYRVSQENAIQLNLVQSKVYFR